MKPKLQEIQIKILGKDRNHSYTLEPKEPFTTINEAIDYLKAIRDNVEELEPTF